MTGDCLKLEIELDKQVYRVHERIMCTIILTNEGSEPVLVNKRLLVNTTHAPEPFRDVTLDITSPSKKKMNFRTRINVGTPGDGDVAELGPWKSVQSVYDVTHDFVFDEKGEYTLKALYENVFDFGDKMEVWKGRLESNALVLQIV